MFTVGNLPENTVDAEDSESLLSYSSPSKVYVYDQNFILIQTFSSDENFDTSFKASVIVNDEVYIGTSEAGMLNNVISTPSEYLQILPNGPIRNNSFRIDSSPNGLIATYGEFTAALNPFPLNSRGLSYFRGNQWNNIPFDSLLGAKVLNKITPNPANPREVYVSSFYDGILVLDNYNPEILFDETNSGLESLILPGNPDVSDIRVSGSAFDNNGLLWSITSRIESPLKSYDPNSGAWRSYSFASLIGDPLTDETGFSRWKLMIWELNGLGLILMVYMPIMKINRHRLKIYFQKSKICHFLGLQPSL